MAYSEARKQATIRYQKAHLDTIIVRVPIGKKEIYMRMAEKKGTSLRALIENYLDYEVAKSGIK